MSKNTHIKAGKLLSNFVRQIAEEESEILLGSGSEDDRMITKAEALAYIMWDAALGKDINETDEAGAKITTKRRPDKTMMALIWERLEGKAPMAVTEPDEGRTAAEKVTEQGKLRIKQAGGKINESGN